MCNYIDLHYMDEALNASSISSIFYLHPSYVTRVFKMAFGMGTYEYIQRKRVEAAKALLDNNIPISKIARECGFRSKDAMKRAFDHYLESPGLDDKTKAHDGITYSQQLATGKA
jgi:AraC-like DNA-binding protein